MVSHPIARVIPAPISRGLILSAVVLIVLFVGAGRALAAVPTVTNVSPASGPAAGGTVVTVTGTGFFAGSTVTFGGSAGTSFVFNSATSVTVTTPPHIGGAVAVVVTNAEGSSLVTGTFSYAPAVTSLNPTSGNALQLVQVIGSGLTGATSVSFGGTSVAPNQVVNDTFLTAIAPAHTAGAVSVVVTTPGGVSPAGVLFTYNVSSAPAVTGLSPLSGLAGTPVTITGGAFTGTTSVNFGGVVVAFTFVNDSQINVIAPAHAAGLADVLVTTNFGTSLNTAADNFTYTGGPVVTSVSPTSGSAGTVVTIFGSGLTGATLVNFGGIYAVPVVVNDSQITVTAPAHSAGLVDLLVTTPSGTSAVTLGDRFTYGGGAFVTSISPTSGSTGTVVTIFGGGLTGATLVNFGGVYAVPTVLSDAQITVTAPAHAAGVVDLLVTTPLGTTVATVSDQFTYASAALAVTGVNPASGPVTGGTTVTISGSGFTGATGVTFGWLSASFTVNSDAQITATAPAITAPNIVNVQVSTPLNNSANTSNNRYTYVSQAPVISSLSPSSGPAAGGTTVFIAGSGFTGVTSVTFGSVAASFSVNSNTQITAVSPARPAGTYDVAVTTSAGTSANTFADNFLYTAPPGPEYCPELPLWTNDSAYGSPGGGFYWDPISGLVWTAQRGWHLFAPQPARPSPEPLWVNALTYGSPGGGFYWDPRSGLVWTAQRTWHAYSPQNCVARP